MSMIYLFFTGGSGNRGCEAIVRGTKAILNDQKIVVYSANVTEDKESGLSQVVDCRALSEPQCKLQRILSHLICSLSYHFGNGKLQVKQIYRSFLRTIKSDNLYLVIGGDVYCYDKPRIYYRMNEILSKNKKILWGCSIEPNSIDADMKKDLLGYDVIYARESITYQGLLDHGIKDNVKLYPDPAFAMKAKECPLPAGFIAGNTIGINASPLIASKETVSGITIRNYKKLIQYILNTTTCPIALIPHVIWNNSDDRIILEELYHSFEDTGRIVMVDSLPAEQIKYVLSKCCFTVVARTHASIAAYSSCVPTLVVGYSVKAKGIAKDLFGDIEHYVIGVQTLKNEDDLSNAFQLLWKQKQAIQEHLQDFMPAYVEKLKELPQVIKTLEDSI